MQWGNVSQLNLEITNVATLTAILFGDPISSFQAPELEVGPHAYLAFMWTLTLNFLLYVHSKNTIHWAIPSAPFHVFVETLVLGFLIETIKLF